MPFLGRDFFPSVDAGQIMMHVRAPVGTRVEETANQFAEISKAIRQIIPPDEIATIVDNIGLPVSGINMTYNNTGTIGTQDGDIQITLSEDHRPTADYVAAAARGAAARASRRDVLVPAGRHRQPDPELRRAGADRRADPRAEPRRRTSPTRTSCCASCATCRASPMRASSSRSTSPGFNVDVDRTRAQYVGLTERDVTNSMVVNLAGSEPDRADLLAQSRERRVLSDRDADAAISDRLAQRAREPADHRRPARRRRRCSAASRRSTARRDRAVVIALQHPADDRDLRHDAGPRPRRGRGRHAEDRRRDGEQPCRAARRSVCAARCRR